MDIMIIGGGPSGLTAANHLVAAGKKPLVLEKSPHLGGLMRSIRYGSFSLDLGRKELYARIPEIAALWNDLLGGDLKPYAHRIGSLYDGKIFELGGQYRGPMRGMPPALLLKGGLDLVRGWIDGAVRSPASYEHFWYQRTGRRFAQVLAQGYWEKFRGQPWRDMPVPQELADGQRTGSHSFAAIAQGLKLAARGAVSRQTAWRHPARGTGQLTDALAARVYRGGGEIQVNAEVVALGPQEDGSFLATVRRDGDITLYRAHNVISGLAPMALDALMHPNRRLGANIPSRSVVLVYLLLDEPPRFPHAWLEVNDPAISAGRITSYAAFGGEMVPSGMTALCVEYFLDTDDPRLGRSNEGWVALALSEAMANRLIDRKKVIDSFVVQMSRCNAAASWREAQDNCNIGLYREFSHHPRLFHVNRPGTDWASYAGLAAAAAILNRDRRHFDIHADPTRSYQASNAIPDRPVQEAT